MPRIPIAQIPNAPRALSASPVDMPSVKRKEVETAFAGVAKAGQRETMALDSFNGVAKGNQAIAEGIGDFAKVAQTFSARQQEVDERAKRASDHTHYVQGQMAAQKAYAEHGDGLAGKDPTKWMEDMPSVRTKLENEINANKNYSPETKQALSDHLTMYGGKREIEVNSSSKIAIFDMDKKVFDMQINSATERGQVIEAKALLETARINGYFNKEQVMGKMETINQQAEFVPLMEVASGANPEEIAEYEYKIGNRSKMTPPQWDRLKSVAKAQTGVLRNSEFDNLASLIKNGKVTDIERGREMFPKLDDKHFDALSDLINSVAKDTPPENSILNELRTRVANYDSVKDQDNSEFYDLNIAFNKYGDRWSTEMRAELQDKRKRKEPQKPGETLRADAFKSFDEMMNNGIFGKVTYDKKGADGKPRISPTPENEKILGIVAHHKDTFNKWAVENPEKAASHVEVNAFIRQLVKETASPVMRGSSDWMPLTSLLRLTPIGGLIPNNDQPLNQPPMSPENLDYKRKRQEMEDGKINAGRTRNADNLPDVPKNAAGGKIGVVTDYGQKDDPTPDSASLGTGKYKFPTGAWNNRLSEDSLAISRDIEAKFKSAGIKEGDRVRLTLSDGSEVIKRWDDRTADVYNGKKLTGRFDFYSPEGPHEKRSVAVTGFEKI